MLRKIVILIFSIALGVASVQAADIPRTINYQGRLTTLSGNALADGTWAITIRLYNNATDAEGASIWSDNYSVQTRNGYFNIVLGSNLSFPLNLAFDKQYYLGIKVGTDAEMTPRQPLQSVPYALSVANLPLSNMVVLTTGSGTYTPSAGVRAILVEVQGGGGGGGGAAYNTGQIGTAGGGRGGGYCSKFITPISASYSYSVGTLGTGGAVGANDGTAGGDSTFGGVLIAKGGQGGVAGTPYPAPRMHSSGSVSITGTTGGDINVQGYNAGYSFSISATVGAGAIGGASKFGTGGNVGFSGASGGNASGFGSGGGGGCAIESTSQAGGNGTPGVIIIWEFK